MSLATVQAQPVDRLVSFVEQMPFGVARDVAGERIAWADVGFQDAVFQSTASPFPGAVGERSLPDDGYAVTLQGTLLALAGMVLIGTVVRHRKLRAEQGS